ncbi:MAG: Bug family tripartite tricarboxylate transporter substrate binding protein [Burkholderiales bacterium]
MKYSIVISTFALWFAAGGAYAQAFPVKPLNIVIPIGPGGGYDFTGRLLAEGLVKELGQPVVAENRAGAGTVVGTQYVVRSNPDGYTMVVGGIGSIAHATALVKDLPYNPGTDLVPLQLVSTNSYTLTSRADFGPKNVQELVAFARANPGKLTMGTPGQGTGQAVSTSLFKSVAGLDILEVQYKNAPPVYIDMMASRVDLFWDATGTAQTFVKAGKVRAIATSGNERDFILPDVPTAKEAGLPEMVMENWTGLFAPAATPRPIVLRLRQAITNVAATADFKKQMTSRGYSLYSPPDVDAFIKLEVQRWPALLAKAGLKPQ